MRSLSLKTILLIASIATFLTRPALAEPNEVSPSPSPAHHRLRNISARASVQADPNVLIAGIIVTGIAPKNVIIRASGPSLNVNGVPVPGRLADPTLELYVSGSDIPIAGNNDWQETQRNEIIATGLAPSNDLEAAIVHSLDPGQYTAVVRGGGGTGIGLIEAYDLSEQSDSKVANISTRGLAGNGDNALIGGLIVGGGENTEMLRVVVRGIGPSLTGHGVPGALADPILQVVDANGALIAGNDNWKDTQGGELEESGLAPTNDLEAAVIVNVPAGNFTAVLRGVGNTSGTALIEIYDAPAIFPLGRAGQF